MRTFHQGRADLHGFTVVVETPTAVHVGRCEDIRDGSIVLLDVESHPQGGPAREVFLQRIAQVGPWPRRARVVITASEVTALRRLDPPAPPPVDTPGDA